MDLLDFARGLQTTFNRNGQKTYIMYHGTTYRNARKIKRDGFIPSSDGMLGRGVYVSRSFEKASAYPISLCWGEEQVVLKLSVKVGRVKRINYQGHPQQKSWYQAGYDTAWVPPNCGMVGSGLEEDCVWDPRRIKVLEILNMDGSVKNEHACTNAIGDYWPLAAASSGNASFTPAQTAFFLHSSTSGAFASYSETISTAANSSTRLVQRSFQSTHSRSLDRNLPLARIPCRSNSVSCLFSLFDDDDDDDFSFRPF